MNRPSPKLLAALVGGALLLAPGRARAIYPIFSSSMTAECIGLGGDCQALRFTLDVVGDHRLVALGLINWNTPVWDFVAIESIKNASGGDVQWWTTLWEPDRFEVELAFGIGYPAVEPIVLTMNTQGSTGGPGDLDNSFTYFGFGCQGLDNCLNKFKVEGAVTALPGGAGVVPEPRTVVLLAIGLALLGGLTFAARH